MKRAYALLGVLFIIIIIEASYAFNHSFTKEPDTGNVISAKQSQVMASLSLKSSAFENDGKIPSKYTCDENREINPPLSIANAPAGTKSLVLIMDDPDVPKQLHPDGMYDHWVVFNIPPPAPMTTLEILEGGPVHGTQGVNGSGKNVYTGPCPPPQYEPSEHRYFFKLYALDAELPLAEGATKQDVERAMQGHILEETQLIGRYKRK